MADIAAELGLPLPDVVKRIKDELRKSWDIADMADHLRSINHARLEALFAAVFPKAYGGDLKSVDAAIKIIESINRMCGLNAATKVDAGGSLGDINLIIGDFPRTGADEPQDRSGQSDQGPDSLTE